MLWITTRQCLLVIARNREFAGEWIMPADNCRELTPWSGFANFTAIMSPAPHWFQAIAGFVMLPQG